MSDEAPLLYENSKGEQFYLHSKIVHLRANNPVPMFFFMRAADLPNAEKNNAKPEPIVPDGYRIRETSTGVPVIYKEDPGQGVPVLV